MFKKILIWGLPWVLVATGAAVDANLTAERTATTVVEREVPTLNVHTRGGDRVRPGTAAVRPESGGEVGTSAVGTTATAPENGMRWRDRTVCVEHHRNYDASKAGKYWYVSSVTPLMDAMTNIRFVYFKDDGNDPPYGSFGFGLCVANGYAQVIHLREEKALNADGTCNEYQYGATWAYDTPDGFTYDGYVSRVEIRVNDCMLDNGLTTDHKKGIVGHELMHGTGPGHWDLCPSLVGPNCTGAVGPSDLDKGRVYAWYAADAA